MNLEDLEDFKKLLTLNKKHFFNKLYINQEKLYISNNSRTLGSSKELIEVINILKVLESLKEEYNYKIEVNEIVVTKF